MKKKLFCLGDGSVSKICLDILKKEKIYDNFRIIKIPKTADIKKLNEIIKYVKNQKSADFILGFANIYNLKINKHIFDFFKKKGVKFINVIDNTAIVSNKTKLGFGVKIYPGVIINRGCKIKNNVLINTGSIVDHDCEIGENSQIAPGCSIAGNVKIGELTFIGIGSSIIQGVKIGKNCIVGAGSVVIKNIPNNSVYAGSPAKNIK